MFKNKSNIHVKYHKINKTENGRLSDINLHFSINLNFENQDVN